MGFATLSNDNRTLLAAGHGFFGRSEDGGQHWQKLATSPANLDMHALTANPTSQTLFAIVVGQGLVTSQDGGQTWQRVASDLGQDSTSLTVFTGTVSMPGMNMTSDHAMLFAALPSGVFASVDDGHQWQRASGSVNLTLNAKPNVLATIGNAVFAGTQSGVYRSDDGGRGWFATNRHFQNPVVALAASPSGLLAAIDSGRNVFVSRDRGATWGG